MYYLALLTLFLFLSPASGVQKNGPDLAKSEDLKALGTGRITLKDNSVFKNVRLMEIKEYWIVYEKNSSSHDMMMEVIRRIEFPNSKWGPLTISFPGNRPEIYFGIR